MSTTQNGTVKTVTKKGTFEGNKGLQYKHLITFEDGRVGMEFTSSDASGFTPGETYDFYYDERADRNGDLWYKVKPAKKRSQAQRPSSGGRPPRKAMSPDRELTIARQSCLKVASEQVVAGNFSPSELLALAEILADWAVGKYAAFPLSTAAINKRLATNKKALKENGGTPEPEPEDNKPY